MEITAYLTWVCPRKFSSKFLSFIGFGWIVVLSVNCSDSKPDELHRFYQQMQTNLLEEFPPVDGKWDNPMSDSLFWAIAFYYNQGTATNNQLYIELAKQAKNYNLSIVKQANQDILWFTEHMNESIMALLGLIEISASELSQSVLSEIDHLLDTTNAFLGEDYYISFKTGFSPTIATAIVALVNSHYGLRLTTSRQPERIETAKQIMAAIEQKAFDGQQYINDPENPKQLIVYVNSTVLLPLVELAVITQETQYITRAEEMFNVLAPYKKHETGGYVLDQGQYNPHFFQLGDECYELSMNCFIALDDLFLYQITQKKTYLEDARQIIDFARVHLYSPEKKVVAHHLTNGHLPDPEAGQATSGPVFFCLGCNFHYLYVMWYYFSLAD